MCNSVFFFWNIIYHYYFGSNNNEYRYSLRVLVVGNRILSFVTSEIPGTARGPKISHPAAGCDNCNGFFLAEVVDRVDFPTIVLFSFNLRKTSVNRI